MKETGNILRDLIELSSLRIEVYEKGATTGSKSSYVYACMVQESNEFKRELLSVSKDYITGRGSSASQTRKIVARIRQLVKGATDSIHEICDECDSLVIQAYEYAISVIKNHNIRHSLKQHLQEYTLSRRMMGVINSQSKKTVHDLVA